MAAWADPRLKKGEVASHRRSRVDQRADAVIGLDRIEPISLHDHAARPASQIRREVVMDPLQQRRTSTAREDLIDVAMPGRITAG